MSGKARGGRDVFGGMWVGKARRSSRGAAHLVEGDGEGEEDEHAGDEPRDEMRGHVVAVHVPRRDGEDDEHEQVYEDPDGLEHLAQHRPPSVPPVLVRAEDHRRTRNATRSRGRNVSRGRTSRPPARCGGGGPDGGPCAHASRAPNCGTLAGFPQRSHASDDERRCR